MSSHFAACATTDRGMTKTSIVRLKFVSFICFRYLFHISASCRSNWANAGSLNFYLTSNRVRIPIIIYCFYYLNIFQVVAQFVNDPYIIWPAQSQSQLDFSQFSLFFFYFAPPFQHFCGFGLASTSWLEKQFANAIHSIDCIRYWCHKPIESIKSTRPCFGMMCVWVLKRVINMSETEINLNSSPVYSCFIYQ